ncbi:MAG: hypothetical protein AAFX99_28920 [Myxococcota bacterium]
MSSTQHQTPHYTYRGRLADAPASLTRRLRWMSLQRAWQAALRQEGQGPLWWVALASYLVSHLLLLSMFEQWLLGLAWINALYIPAVVLLWRLTYVRLAEPDPNRLERVRRWLERLAEVLPPQTPIELDATLGSLKCTNQTGRPCGSPWLMARLELPQSQTIELQLTAGRSCPLVRRIVPPDHTRLDLELTATMPSRAQIDAQLSPTPSGLRTRRLDLYRSDSLRWVLEQSLNTAGDAIPIWPIVRLVKLARGLPQHGSAAADTLHDTTPIGPLTLRPARLTLSEALYKAEQALVPQMPTPSVGLMAAFMVLNGVLGVGALALSTSTAPPATGLPGGIGWAAFFVAHLVLGLAYLAPTLYRVHRLTHHLWQPITSRHIGALELDRDGLAIVQRSVSELGLGQNVIDLSRPFKVHLCREAGLHPEGHLRLAMTLLQREVDDGGPLAGSVRRVEVGTRIRASDALMHVPAKQTQAPELDEDDFRLLWDEVEQACEAHGQPVPRLR